MNNPLDKELTLITGDKMTAGEFLEAYRQFNYLRENKPHLWEQLLDEARRNAPTEKVLEA